MEVRAGSGANLQGNGYIESVDDIGSCAQICNLVENCQLVSFHKEKKRCYLKNGDAVKVKLSDLALSF